MLLLKLLYVYYVTVSLIQKRSLASLYAEIFSFEGAGIEAFHCMQMFSFEEVGIEGFHCMQVFSFQGVGIKRFHGSTVF